MKFLAKKIVFLVSRELNEISPLLAPRKNLDYPWSNALLVPPGKNPSDAHDHKT